MINYIIIDKNCVLGNRNTEYLSTEWKGADGNLYLARGRDLRTERSEVLAS